MIKSDFQIELTLDATPARVFNAINNVKGWWSENIEGDTDIINGIFVYQYKDVHVCQLKITELVPNRKVVWEVLENQFNFTRDPHEWKGDKIVFEIDEKGGYAHLRFTQMGLTKTDECFDVCRDAWTSYIKGSLHDLILTGHGKPNTRENDLNRDLIKKWGLPVK